MAAMIIPGVQPGPMLMINQPTYIYEVVTITLIASLCILVFGLVMVRPLLWVLRIPRSVIMPVIFVLCVVGSFAIASRLFDVYLMLAIGVLAFVLRRAGYPIAPFVLGLVLGDILDKSLRRGLMLTDGDPTPFFTRPISAVLVVATVGSLLLMSPRVRGWLKSAWRARPGAAQARP
jgi:putative tricarboxylic transport membrane protein